MSQKIGILGSGEVARTLAQGFLALGHAVKVGTRSPSKLKEWQEGAKNASVGTFEEAADFGEMLVLAVKGVAAEALVKSMADKLSGKTVIDTTNPISESPPVNGVLGYFTGPNESLLERLQRLSPKAKFVKAFNSVGSGLMVNPKLPGGRPTMFIAGDDEGARKEVARILDELGWDTADMGSAAAGRAIEPLAMLWCIPGFLRNEWSHAFKLVSA
ncbi:MAG: NAD(P)-binding domain-containing protein [Cytophagales bacterium]|nr:NAD(P)-binding domain-containing protein [Cytophagales bacterium]